jgi:putative transposon-encoded protein
MSKKVFSEEFEFTVQKCGNSAHIRLSNKWLGKRIRVKIEQVDEE